MTKKLYRSSKKRVIAGVCGGLSDFLSFDVTIIRIGVVIISVATSFVPILLIYIACALIIPLEPSNPGDMTIDAK